MSQDSLNHREGRLSVHRTQSEAGHQVLAASATQVLINRPVQDSMEAALVLKVGASLINSKTKLQQALVIRPLVDLEEWEDSKLKISFLGQDNHNHFWEEELRALQASEQ
jgi:hypothetical protein